MGVPKECGLL
jgi:DNA topoisomerase I